MKKICFVATVSITVRAFILPLIKYLKEKTDWDISVICDEDASLPADLPEGVRYFPVSMKRGISIGGISAMLQMARIFGREKFDLVQYSTPNASLYASIAACLGGIKNRKYHLMGLRFLGFSGVKRSIFRLIERLTCALSSEIECVSKSNLEYGVENKIFPRRKAGVVFHGSSVGVDLERFDISKKDCWRSELRKHFKYTESDCVFGFAGRITGDKGINEFLTAFSGIENDNAKLFILGRMDGKDAIDQLLLSRAEKDPRVTFCNYVSDIERYYAMMDVLVLPSYREGFGNIIIEAEAMGVPVIVTDIPGPIDAMVPNHTGIKVQAKNSSALKSAMEELLSDVVKRNAFGHAGREYAEAYFDQRKVFEYTLAKLKKSLNEAS